MVQKVQKVQRVVVAAPPQIKKGSAAGAAGCVERLCMLRSGERQPYWAEGSGIVPHDEYKVSVMGVPFRFINHVKHSHESAPFGG